jgi:hypothetical protein
VGQDFGEVSHRGIDHALRAHQRETVRQEMDRRV